MHRRIRYFPKILAYAKKGLLRRKVATHDIERYFHAARIGLRVRLSSIGGWCLIHYHTATVVELTLYPMGAVTQMAFACNGVNRKRLSGSLVVGTALGRALL